MQTVAWKDHLYQVAKRLAESVQSAESEEHSARIRIDVAADAG